MDATVLLLAGGRSRRMGRDKALLRQGGRRILDLWVDHYARRASEVLVASGSRRLRGLSVRQVQDPPGRRGPLAGLCAGLAAARRPWILAVACDQPPPPDALLAALARGRRGVQAVLLADGKHRLPLPALYHRSILPTAWRLRSRGRGPSALPGSLRCRTLPEASWQAADPEGRTRAGWNTPAAFRRWLGTGRIPP